MNNFYFVFLFLFTFGTINAQETTSFDTPRFLGASTVTGDSAYVLGGTTSGLTPSAAVNIYDRNTSTWTTDELSLPRALPGATATGIHLLVGGGIDPRPNGTSFEVVDIYDRVTKTWSVESLSDPVLLPMTVGNDSLAFFAGGLIAANGFFAALDGRATIDIFNSNSESWSVMELSEPRGAGAAVRVGDYLVFAGGLINDTTPSKRIDIYNAATGQWTIDSLSEARFYLSGVTDGTNVYFAGGLNTASDHFAVIDIYNPATGEKRTESLSRERANVMAGFSCGKVVFASGAITNWDTRFISEAFTDLEIYDPLTDEWIVDQLTDARYGGYPASFDDQFIIASGFSTTAGLINTAVSYSCEFLTSTLNRKVIADAYFSVSPNPVAPNTTLQIDWKEAADHIGMTTGTTYQLINPLGQIIANGTVENNEIDLAGALTPGHYTLVLKMDANDQYYATRLLVK